MVRPRDSRSPSPAGNQGTRRQRRDDDRRDRDRRDDGRDYRRRSRSRTPEYRRRDRDRGGRDRDRDDYRRRDRSIGRDRRDDDYYRGGRDRRRSRDRYGDRTRSPERRRERSQDGGDRRNRDDRRGDDNRSNRTDSRNTPLTDSGRADSSKSTPNAAQVDADKQAQKLARLEAWKKKKEQDAHNQKDVNPSQTRSLLAEMDRKPSGASSAVASPMDSGIASPVQPYAGKFDPKSIAKKSAGTRADSPKGALGGLNIAPETLAAAPAKPSTVSKLPTGGVKTSAFGFGKVSTDNDKLSSKRKLDLDEEDDTKRKLTKLPTLLDTDDTPYADQDDDEDSDGDNFAENEEEAAAAARAAHEKRLQTEAEAAAAADETNGDSAAATNDVEMNGAEAEPAAADNMEVDEEDEIDPLDAFMADLGDSQAKKPAAKTTKSKALPEPEAYFSEDAYSEGEEEDPDAKRLLAIANKRKKKEIPTTDYSKITLEPIRKNFWVEPAELSMLSEQELADLRLELDGIKINGKDVPKPVQKWAQCGLTRQTLDVIEGLGYEKPTSIQMQALPAIMSGRDVVGVAKTGSGKTVAFLLPMFRHIKDQKPLKDGEGPVGLIMTPTRELATQIHRDCKPFLKSMGLRSVCAYGGAPIRDQIAELKRGAEIVVCTPGRMIDLLAANQGRVTNLRRVSYVVLDEADRMFDMGFEPQVMKIFANMRPDKQTILFSATMPRIIDSLTKKVLKNPVEITVGGRSVVAKEIEQVVEVREENTKFLRVLELLGDLYDKDEDARSLIFVERQEKADDLLKELMTKGYPCMSIHGGKDQIDRDSTISDFKKGVVPILIATSVAARGLDVKQLKLVINYDAPNHLEDYVHRAGRTGRAGNTGTAVTFITPEQENCAVGIAKALEQSEQPVPERLEEMRKAYREKVKSGKAKENSGFGGKGLDKLDQEREAARLRERKTHKVEGEEEEEKEETKKSGSGGGEDDANNVEKALDAIKAATSSIQSRDANKAEGADSRAELVAGASGDKSGNPLDKVSSAVSAINSRLGKAGQLRAGQSIDNKGPDAGSFHATLEINDFPQKARWAVTNRTNVAKILDSTATSITTKGNFYPAGKEVPEGAEPKLYILIEGDTEIAVSGALNELTRLLKEGTIAAAESDSRAPTSGRYTIT
ncbi:Putative Pre-mRNA-processing ATP-dependent RNA helicase PRP5 [[Torrubiella] hemipterigena]|uniref:RNA helicase n=1 Tax=[Torrubiella] hemipterigena TaxID=1531966 RepID=A0A0A1TCH6_9HYPO|nr:Putative Pre-mRNA-processing ATP-dependent RNA helicase PRP5 [[Torrubiella] hemipterigena]